MYYEHLHGDGMTQLGLLKPGGRPAHRFYLLAMARRRGGSEGGEGGDARERRARADYVPGDRGTRPHKMTENERRKQQRARAAARASASGAREV